MATQGWKKLTMLMAILAVFFLFAAHTIMFCKVPGPVSGLSDGMFMYDWTTRNTRDSFSLCPHDIAIVGAGGYVGSKLLLHFSARSDAMGLTVMGYERDLGKFFRKPELPVEIREMSSGSIPLDELHCFKFIVYLGGLTGRKECNLHPDDVTKENVEDITTLARRMHGKQTLIFASTSAIAEGSGSIPASETFHVNVSLLDRYCLSLWEREKALMELSAVPGSPTIIGLRFGTVVGIAPSQRTDLLLMSLLRSAYTTGILQVQNPNTHRAFLWTEDLARAVERIVSSPAHKHFAVYNLQSFHCSIIKIGNYLAWKLGARLKMLASREKSMGFSLSTAKFEMDYNFSFMGTIDLVVSELLESGARILRGRSPRKLTSPLQTVPCVICGSHHLEHVLDLDEQPLANDFQLSDTKAMASPRHSLRIVTCPRCHHSQLSYIVPRSRVFEHYLYRSGTTSTLKKYFDWFAEKVISEKMDGRHEGTVLEIACNDGTQLDSFSSRGWRTFGVDPAKNLVEIARSKGHSVHAEFWGQRDIPDLPADIDAIIAQNVLAHTDSPLHFMEHAAKHMQPHTKMYVQTSQCQMYQRGEFDTIYHEHISFFTAHSFQKLADMTDLTITNFELVPIHGTSCLVTFQRRTNVTAMHAHSLLAAIDKEKYMGLEHSWYYVQYEEHALEIRKWMVSILNTLHSADFKIVGYGAAAKAIVMLHFLMRDPDFHADIMALIDDSPLKQNTFCPGTSIPVQGLNYLASTGNASRIVIVVFAWNFFDEVAQRLVDFATAHRMDNQLFLLRPFPAQELFRLAPYDSERKTLEKVMERSHEPMDPNRPLMSQENSQDRKKLVMVTHFYNEEFLLPQFIRNHVHMFDEVVLIDQNSSDSSVSIIEKEAPPSWRVIRSRSSDFGAESMDQEVMAQERALCVDCWKIALTTTEFLIHPNLRQFMSTVNPDVKIFSFRSLWIVGNDSQPYDPDTLLPAQRSQFSMNADQSYDRRMHCFPDLIYFAGRHSTDKDAERAWFPEALLFKYKYSPWPETLPRKLQISSRIPDHDKSRGLGVQHLWTMEEMEVDRMNLVNRKLVDLKNIPSSSEDDDIKLFHEVWMKAISAGPELVSTLW